MKVDYHDKIITLINDGNIETAKMYVGKVMHENYVYHARKLLKNILKVLVYLRVHHIMIM